MNQENAIFKRLARRLKSARGSVYIEFAFVMMLVLPLIFFSVDFMRILYVEQQLEIASRLCCDIDSHMRQLPDKGRPTRTAKVPVKMYLKDALAKDGFEGLDQDGALANVWCKGDEQNQKGPVQWIVNGFKKAVGGWSESGNFFLKLLGGIIRGALNFLTFGTDAYLLDVIPTDKVIRSSVTVRISRAFPSAKWPKTFFGNHMSDGRMMIPQVALRLDSGKNLVRNRRVRYYTHMPSFDTCPVAPSTYARKMLKVFGKWLGR